MNLYSSALILSYFDASACTYIQSCCLKCLFRGQHMNDWQLNFLTFPLVCGLEYANCKMQKDIKEGVQP